MAAGDLTPKKLLVVWLKRDGWVAALAWHYLKHIFAKPVSSCEGRRSLPKFKKNQTSRKDQSNVFCLYSLMAMPVSNGPAGPL